MSLSVAIIGAGLCGSLIAHRLSQEKCSTTVFEKSRGRGGRASTKLMPWGQFDLGVPLIPATAQNFIGFMSQLELEGRAHRWPATKQHIFQKSSTDQHLNTQYFVFNGKMNSICHHWLQSSDFRPDSLVTNIKYQRGRGWQLRIDETWAEEFFDVLICTVPWPQAKILLDNSGIAMSAAEQPWASCWSIGIKIHSVTKPNARVIHFQDHPLQTLILDSEKPERPELRDEEQIWVAQLNHELSASLGKIGKDKAILVASQSLCQYLNIEHCAVQYTEGHFWRFARSEKGQKPLGIIHHQDTNLLVGGDWSFGASVQSVFNASLAIMEKVLQLRR